MNKKTIQTNIYRNHTKHIVDLNIGTRTIHIDLSNKDYITIDYDGQYEGIAYIYEAKIDIKPLPKATDWQEAVANGLPLPEPFWTRVWNKLFKRKYVPQWTSPISHSTYRNFINEDN